MDVLLPPLFFLSKSASRRNEREIDGAYAKPMVKIKVTLPDPPETDGPIKGSSPVRGNAYDGFIGG
jgi:hypothetical protein